VPGGDISRHEANVVVGLVSAWAVIPNDLNQPIEHGLADAGTSVEQHSRHILTIAWMAAFESDFELPDGFGIPQSLL
jgi:hypothetical protein